MAHLDLLLKEHVGQANDDQLKLLRTAIYNARSSPVDITGSEQDFVALSINIAAKRAPETPASYQSARALLQDAQWVRKAAATAKGLVSHSIKFADARYSGGLFIPESPDGEVTKRLVSSASTQLERPLDWSGNSADLTKKLLFATAFCWHGQVMTLTEALAARIEVFVQAFKNLGISGSLLQEVLEAVDQAAAKRVPTGKSYKTLYFPRVKSGDYLQVTPVPSVAMQREIYHRTLRDHQPADRYTRIRKHRVGETTSGAKNVGDFYSTTVGIVRMLHGGFFNPESKPEDRRLAVFLSGRPVWGQIRSREVEGGKKESPFRFMQLEEATGRFGEKMRAWQHQILAPNFYRLLRHTVLAPVIDYAGRYRLGELEIPPDSPRSPLHYLVSGPYADEQRRNDCHKAIVAEVERQYRRFHPDGFIHKVAREALDRVLEQLIDQLTGGRDGH